jgi:hypothetical protein
MSKPKVDWDTVEDLGQTTDIEIAKRLGVSSYKVRTERRARGIPRCKPPKSEGYDWDSLPLGEVSDADIARKYGLKPTSIGTARRRRGIPSFVEEGKTRPDHAKKNIDWDSVEDLGKVPDLVLAKRLGLSSVTSVTRARKYRGIAKYAPPTRRELELLYDELRRKWDSIEAIEARYRELTALE